jgi:hypothetical protein
MKEKYHLTNFCARKILNKYCGVFTQYKNYNIQTRSRDYATVDEAVFSPCRTEQCRASA